MSNNSQIVQDSYNVIVIVVVMIVIVTTAD